MERRLLGRTGLEVGVIGFGTEFLLGKEHGTAVDLVKEAVDQGVSYFDNWMPQAEVRDVLGAAFRGQRDKVQIAGHLGPCMTGGQSDKSRDPGVTTEYFHDMLRRLHTDYVDVLVLFNIDAEDDYANVMRPGGLLEIAQRLRAEGKARFIGYSGHISGTSIKAVESGHIDVIMSPVCITWKPEGVAEACARHGVGLVGMKPFRGGELFQEPYSEFVTPVKAISFSLAQPAVACIVPGFSNRDELRQALAYLSASPDERDFSHAAQRFSSNDLGACVYCGHCLPCSAGINISDTMWALRAQKRGSPYARDAYGELSPAAEACTACGACVDRCPQKVDIPNEMAEAVRLFGKKA